MSSVHLAKAEEPEIDSTANFRVSGNTEAKLHVDSNKIAQGSLAASTPKDQLHFEPCQKMATGMQTTTRKKGCRQLGLAGGVASPSLEP